MKTKKNILILLFACLILCSSTCGDGNSYKILYTSYTPVFMKRADLENSITIGSPRVIGAPSKIYTKDNYLYVSESGVGVHIINNTNPANPVNEHFIKIVGCNDMAIKGNVLYADNATDLVAIDISNPSSLKINSREVNAFPEPTTPDGYSVRPEHSKDNRPADLILVKWKK
jgi:hypothetical protein